VSDPIPPQQIPLEPSNDLEGVMVQVAAGTRDEAAFFQRLWESELLIPQDGEGEQPAEAGAEVALRVATVREERAVVAFSSERQLRKAAGAERPGFVRLAVPALQAMLRDTGVHLVINPSADLATMLDPVQVAALPERRSATRVPSDAEVSAAELDPGLAETLSAYFREREPVQAAYAAELDGRLAVGVLLDAGADPSSLFSDAGTALDRPDIPPFGMLVVDPSDPGPVGGWMLREGRPFYER
jgi:hypothetical protein